MSSLESLHNNDFSSEKIPIIFENQRKNLKQDVLFLKEDILKDFRQIESKLNIKYEKQNSNTLSILNKFENTIESMNGKILKLASLISTDNNIQQKVSQFDEYKAKVSDTLLSLELGIKNNGADIKNAINKYDKLFTDSVIYPGIIGHNGKFATFHELIDFVLINLYQFVEFKEKYMIDFKSYKSKLENLLKSFKKQSDSIISSNNQFTNKKISELEKKIRQLINAQETKIFDVRLENNKSAAALEGKVDDLNNEVKKMQDLKIEIYTKFDDEIKLIKDYTKIVYDKYNGFQNDYNLMKEKIDTLSNSIKELQIKYADGLKKETNFINVINLPKKKNLPNNNSQLMRSTNAGLARSIIKKYIEGEININDLENKNKKQRSIFLAENEAKTIWKNININNSNKKYTHSLDNLSLSKRMTFEPEKFKNLRNGLSKFNDMNSIYSDKSLYNKSNKSNNSINEEKDEDFEIVYTLKEITDDNKSKTTDKISDTKDEKLNNNNLKNEEENINKVKNSPKVEFQKNNLTSILEKKYNTIKYDDKFISDISENKNILINKNNAYKNICLKEGAKILKFNNKDINKEIQTDNICINANKKESSNLKEKNTDNINKNKILKKKEVKDSSCEKSHNENNNSFPKVANNIVKSLDQNKKINQKKVSIVGKLSKIGSEDNIINYSKTNTNKLNKIKFGLFEKKKNRNNNRNSINNINSINKINSFNSIKSFNKVKNINYFNNIKIIKTPNSKINIIEVNFDNGNTLHKEKDELKSLISKIKENRINNQSERNNKTIEKYKIFRKLKINGSDISIENNLTNGYPSNSIYNNLSNYYSYYNKKVKDDIKNKTAFGYLYYVKNNKNIK